jgi:two-component system sensor histidine kinase DesK
MTTSTNSMKPRPRNWAWLWLSYTGFLFINPALSPHLYNWVGTLVVFATFLVIFRLYFACDNDSSPRQFWLIAATFALGLVTFPWNQGGSCLMVYAFCFLPFALASVRRVFFLFALGTLTILAEGAYFHDRHGAFHVSWPDTFVAIFLVLIIGCGNIFFAEQRRFNIAQAAAQRDLQAAQQENLTLAAVAERERIARDLHDVLGHTLSLIVLKAELAGRLVSIDPARATNEIADVERTARTALAEVREAIGGYRARGLAAEIESARLTLDSAGVTLIAESSHANAALSAQEETVLALSLREAITNIVRHARATTCTLRFVVEDGSRRLVVEDNGQSLPLQTPREGNGLRGMRERIESIGGHFLLERGGSAEKSGTRILITLPQPGHAV